MVINLMYSFKHKIIKYQEDETYFIFRLLILKDEYFLKNILSKVIILIKNT